MDIASACPVSLPCGVGTSGILGGAKCSSGVCVPVPLSRITHLVCTAPATSPGIQPLGAIPAEDGVLAR